MSQASANPADEDTVSLSEHLVAQLQRRILSGQVEVGSWLRHATIADEFGISRTPVREALRVLHSQGVVTIVPNRGARVNGLSARDIRELGEIRGELEGYAAELAATRIDDRQIGCLHQAIDDFRAAIEDYTATPERALEPEADSRWSETNEAFHGTVLRAAANRQLILAIADVSRRLPRNSNYPAYAGNTRLLKQNLAEHETIAAAIIAQDPPGARRAMVDHIRSSAELLMRIAPT